MNFTCRNGVTCGCGIVASTDRQSLNYAIRTLEIPASGVDQVVRFPPSPYALDQAQASAPSNNLCALYAVMDDSGSLITVNDITGYLLPEWTTTLNLSLYFSLNTIVAAVKTNPLYSNPAMLMDIPGLLKQQNKTQLTWLANFSPFIMHFIDFSPMYVSCS